MTGPSQPSRTHRVSISRSKFIRILQNDKKYSQFIDSDKENSLMRIGKRTLPERISKKSELDLCISACLDNYMKSSSSIVSVLISNMNLLDKVKLYIYAIFDQCIIREKIKIDRRHNKAKLRDRDRKSQNDTSTA